MDKPTCVICLRPAPDDSYVLGDDIWCLDCVSSTPAKFHEMRSVLAWTQQEIEAILGWLTTEPETLFTEDLEDR